MKTSRIAVACRLLVTLLACGAMAIGVWAGQTDKKTKTSSASKSDAKVDLNTATEKDLENLPGVGAATAKKIIAGRPYSSVDGLSKAGVSASTIKKITPLVTVSGGTAAAASTKADTKTDTKTSSKESSSAKETAPASQPASTPPAKAAAASTSQGTPGAGMVWVNLESSVYHYEGSQYYGKTKKGKYMSEADAVKAGYRAAKNEKKPQ